MRLLTNFIFVVFSTTIIWINFSLHSPILSEKLKNEDIILQLNFLEEELKENNLGSEMQGLFPEGFVFVNALYGLTWCELIINNRESTKELKQRSLSEALFAFNQVNQGSSTSNFDENLNPKYGIFYSGWRNYLLSKILLAHSQFEGRDDLVLNYKENCEHIESALLNSNSPFLESYRGNSWPADMSIAMASMSNYDKILAPKYKSLISKWIANVKSKLDPKTGLLPYKVNSKTGLGIQSPRGSGTALYLRMLSEIDHKFGIEQYKLFKVQFIETTFGLPSIREYPKDTKGLGDIDSGPVILGVGFSATIVSIGTISLYEKSALSSRLYQTVNAFGFEIKTDNKKKYIFGKLPMADAFIAWSRASQPHIYLEHTPSSFWRIKFHLYSVLVLTLFSLFHFRKRIFFRFSHKDSCSSH